MNRIFDLLLCLCAVLLAFLVSADVRDSDFAKISDLKFYVDKTSVIKDFFTDSDDHYHVKVITAPPKFGKTTLVDSIKKFFSLQVDVPASLDVKYWKENSNYKVFCKKPLDICKNDKKFFKENFGLHPVIHIDFKLLREVKNFNVMRKQLQRIVSETFVEHIYLIENTTIFLNEANRADFIEHCDCDTKQVFNLTDLLGSFNWLSQLMYVHFNQKIIVLIDDYDSIFHAIFFRNISKTDTDQIIENLSELNSRILFQNQYVFKALVAGAMRTKDLKQFLNGTVKEYNFLDDHMFSECFGATEKEVEQLIETHTPKGKRKQTKNVLKQYYDGYLIKNRNVRMYNLLSFSVFVTNKVIKRPYWIRGQRMRVIIPNDNITARSVINLFPKLLSRPCVYGDTSRSLSINVIDTVKGYKNCSKSSTADFRDWFVSYLYESGYLSTTGKFAPKVSLNKTLDPLVIPNVEVKLEFVKFYLSNCWLLYQKYNNTIANNINNAIRMFMSDGHYMEGCEHLFAALRKMLEAKRPETKEDFKNIILYMLAKKHTLGERLLADLRTTYLDNGTAFERVPLSLLDKDVIALYYKRISGNVTRTTYLVGALDIFCLNVNNVGIFIESKFLHEDESSTVEGLAKDGILQIILSYDKVLNENSSAIDARIVNTKAKIFIGLAFDKITGKLSLGFYNPSTRREPIFINS